MHYRSLVATQTGNLLLLIAGGTISCQPTIMRFHLFYFLSQHLVCPPYQEYRKTALLADQDVNSFVCGSTPGRPICVCLYL